MSEVSSDPKMPENLERNANLQSDLRRARAIFWEKYHGISAVIDQPPKPEAVDLPAEPASVLTDTPSGAVTDDPA